MTLPPCVTSARLADRPADRADGPAITDIRDIPEVRHVPGIPVVREPPGMRDPDVPDMAELPVQRPESPRSTAEARARYFNSGNAFDQKLPAVPARSFDEVAAQALGSAVTGLFWCDQSAALGSPGPATTPLMLARYAHVAPGEALPLAVEATGVVAYVIRGAADCLADGMRLGLSAGDVLLLPGGRSVALHAGPAGALLWIVGNEPQLAFDGARPGAEPVVDVVHYPAAEIERQLARLAGAGTNASTSGHALIFSSERQEASRNLTPSLTLSFNTLQPGATQRMHRHNSAAITLVVQGAGCHSTVDGTRCDWTPWTTMVTPPGAPHAHQNDGDAGARFLIVQDGGLHYHARTMGFAFL